MLPLIDGGVVRYRAAAGAQYTQYHVYAEDDLLGTFRYDKELKTFLASINMAKEDFTVVPELIVREESIALGNAKSLIQKILRKFDTEDYELFLSDGTNYRNDVAEDYKANRRDVKKPEHLKAVDAYLRKHWNAITVTGEEDDDALGYTQYNSEEPTVICTNDKDLNGIPGAHWDFTKPSMDDEPVKMWTEVESNRFFYTQLLVGDSTDNIPGLYKTTGKMARAKVKAPLQEMNTPEEMYAHVRAVYVESGVGFEDIDETLTKIGQLLWIRRTKNEFWKPPE